MKENELFDLLRLSLIDKIGPTIGKKLIAYLGGSSEVFRASRSDFTSIDGIGELHYRSFKEIDTSQQAHDIIEEAIKNNVRILSFLEDDYPHRLKQCMDSPMVMYYQGDAQALTSSRMVSIVGTRNATRYGTEFTEQFVKELVDCGVVVVSGLAYGIDAAAHRAALKYQGRTIGVVAHGLDRMSPTQHRSLADKMKAEGGLISEHRIGVKVEKGFFPMRNRIVAGISDATVVIESDKRGGSLITGHLANDYNRDVFALPGRIDDQFSRGCNALIQKNVAHVLNDVDEFMKMMGWEDTEKKQERQMPLFIDLVGTEKQVFTTLRRKPKTVDVISIESELPMSQVSSTLLTLEFKGLVKALPGKQYAVV